ncbi:origin recognition complex subunit 1 isoform X2 [Rhinoderma darwinii]|uniref:origin recognition complex subunit 1 isoform X2 n=1 Tax=Rhinoderma darwinii TaxID=43563 RepID=UPI003F67A3DD
MTKYNTRVRRRRVYSWGLVMMSSGTEAVTITPGDFILIEGDDEERPFVAKLKELYDDGAEKDASKHAIVQWFLRYEEVSFKKRKLLGRDPHPQEIFLYDDNACENDIDAETIIGTVQVTQLKLEDPFPRGKLSGNVLYVKLSWDGKAFKPITSSLFQKKENTVNNGPVSNKTLPKPQFYSFEGDAVESRQISRSATRAHKNEAEIESRHSASKSSHSKERGMQRIPNGTDTPGVRKKLQLNSPSKSQGKLSLERDSLLDDDFRALEPAAPKRRVAFSGLPDSPPKKMLTDEDLDLDLCFVPLKSLSDQQCEKLRLRLTPLRATLPEENKSSRSPTEVNNGRKRSEKGGKVKPNTPQKQNVTLKTNSCRRPTEEQDGGELQTSRLRRKSAQAFLNSICKKVKILSEEDSEDLGEDTDVVPLKESKVFSSSEDDDEEEAEREDTSPKRAARKRLTPSTPTSSRRSSARTPNKTPVSKAAHVATSKIPERNQPVQKPANVLEEARIRTEGNHGRKLSEEGEKVKPKTPQKRNVTPRTNSYRRPTEEQDGGEPQTPRSRRKSAQASANLIRKQIKILSDEDSEDLDEDTDFVPLKDSKVFSSDEEEEEEDDDEAEREDKKSPRRATRKSLTPRTPTSSRRSSARTPNKTPVSKAAHVATPKIPERNQPVQKPANVLEEARIRLHVSAVPESLPCREQEYQDVYNFVESKLLDGTGGCMYISGVPGTGKTATIHEVIRSLQTAVEDDDLPSFQFIEINGMKLTDPHQAYVQILKLLTGQKATADHSAALLEKRFSTPASNRETTVLLVDELDLLWTRKQNVMYSLFDWPTRKCAKLIVLAIANTMDLPERIMMNRVASRLGLTRMSFQPYTHKQLQQIITSRLNHVKAFEDDAIQLVSRKVAALSGDARRCLDICRRATEICEFSIKKGELSLVKMPHVIEALDEMFSSPYIMAIRSSSVQEQAFLKAVIAEFRRSGLEEATFQQVYHQYIALCRIEGVQPPTMSETMAVCLRLGASRLLLVESSRNDLYLRVRINVSQDDIMYALKEG